MKHLTYVLTLLVCILLGSCRSADTAPSVVVHTQIDTLRILSHSTDTILCHDSIYTLVKGDTVITDRWHTLYKYHYLTDTLYQSNVDSIPVPYEVTIYVKYTPWYTKVLAWAGGISILAVFLFIIYKTRI